VPYFRITSSGINDKRTQHNAFKVVALAVGDYHLNEEDRDEETYGLKILSKARYSEADRAAPKKLARAYLKVERQGPAHCPTNNDQQGDNADGTVQSNPSRRRPVNHGGA
jgi:hypothetical protein